MGCATRDGNIACDVGRGEITAAMLRSNPAMWRTCATGIGAGARSICSAECIAVDLADSEFVCFERFSGRGATKVDDAAVLA